MEKRDGVLILDGESPLSLLRERYIDNARLDKKQDTINHEIAALLLFEQFSGAVTIAQVTAERADAFKLHLAAKFTQNTTRTRLSILRGVFRYAVALQAIASNPFDSIKLPRVQFSGRAVPDAELSALLGKMPPALRTATRLALYTGMRIGEVVCLEWSQVGPTYIVIPGEKSKNGKERIIPISRMARAILGRSGIGRVFTHSKSRLERAICRAWKELRLKRVRFHDLRHTAATRALENCDDPKLVQDAFGWANIASTQPYQHLTPERIKRGLGIRYRGV